MDEVMFGMFLVENVTNQDGSTFTRTIHPCRVRFDRKNGRYAIINEPNPFQRLTVDRIIEDDECTVINWAKQAAAVAIDKFVLADGTGEGTSWNVACRLTEKEDERESRNGIGPGKGTGLGLSIPKRMAMVEANKRGSGQWVVLGPKKPVEDDVLGTLCLGMRAAHKLGKLRTTEVMKTYLELKKTETLIGYGNPLTIEG
jgi:hypothetical protein